MRLENYCPGGNSTPGRTSSDKSGRKIYSHKLRSFSQLELILPKRNGSNIGRSRAKRSDGGFLEPIPFVLSRGATKRTGIHLSKFTGILLAALASAILIGPTTDERADAQSER